MYGSVIHFEMSICFSQRRIWRKGKKSPKEAAILYSYIQYDVHRLAKPHALPYLF